MNQANLPKPRRGLSADALIDTLRRRFKDVHDSRRQASCDYTMSDTLMSAFAMFFTKEPSMLSFEDHQHLFDQVIEKMDQDNCRIETRQVASAKEKIHTETSCVAGVSLNKSNAGVRVNFLLHHEFDCSGGAVTKRFSWVTDIDLSDKNAQASSWGIHRSQPSSDSALC